MGDVRHNCGLAVAHSLDETYALLASLQHRGRDAAGIAAIGDGRIDVVKWAGRVESFGIKGLHEILGAGKRRYDLFLGHVRYATRGRKDQILEDAHPHVIGGEWHDRGSHILIVDCESAAVHNGQVAQPYFQSIAAATPQLRTSCDTEALLHLFRQIGEQQLLRQVHGAFTLAIADRLRRDVIVMRDRTGIRPGVLGVKGGIYSVASEDVAFTENGGEVVEDLEPGTLYHLTADGRYTRERIVPSVPRHCFFEWTYIGNRNSDLSGIKVRRLRAALGEALAAEFRPGDADLVTYLPRCSDIAARSYADAAQLDFAPTLYKVKDERAFQGADAAERTRSISTNLYLLPNAAEILHGKAVIMIDDSTIRGTNARRARELLLSAGARKVYLANYIPPVGIIPDDTVPRGCEFGVDMPPDSADFIARGRSIDQISDALSMQVAYLSLDGLLRTFERLGMPRDNLCYFCVGGPHPFAGL